MGEAVEHIPQSVPPSFSPPHLPPAAAAAAALRRARTPQCKDCSSITFGARQGLVFRGQRANFSDGYIVQLDSLLAQASPHVSNSSSVPQLNTASAPYTPTLYDVQRSWTKLTHGRLAQLSAYNESQLIINDVQRSWTKLTHGRLAQLSAYNESQLIIRPDIPPSACVRAPRKMARSTKAFDA